MGLAAKGSTFSFGSQVARVVDIRRTVGGQVIDATDLSSTEAAVILDLDDEEITIEVNGTPTIDRGDIADATLAWNTGVTAGPKSMVCTQKGQSGRRGAIITSTFTFKAAASES